MQLMIPCNVAGALYLGFTPNPNLLQTPKLTRVCHLALKQQSCCLRTGLHWWRHNGARTWKSRLLVNDLQHAARLLQHGILQGTTAHILLENDYIALLGVYSITNMPSSHPSNGVFLMLLCHK
jgi:hypothetical protein